MKMQARTWLLKDWLLNCTETNPVDGLTSLTERAAESRNEGRHDGVNQVLAHDQTCETTCWARMGPKFTRLLWLVLAVQLLILYKISSNSKVEDIERHADALQPQNLRRSSLHARAEAEAPTASKRSLHNPLPGVHMVYMYANGTDPAVSGPRAQFGGPVSGKTSSAVVAVLEQTVSKHNSPLCVEILLAAA